jgi:hypothetical protein
MSEFFQQQMAAASSLYVLVLFLGSENSSMPQCLRMLFVAPESLPLSQSGVTAAVATMAPQLQLHIATLHCALLCLIYRSADRTFYNVTPKP